MYLWRARQKNTFYVKIIKVSHTREYANIQIKSWNRVIMYVTLGTHIFI